MLGEETFMTEAFSKERGGGGRWRRNEEVFIKLLDLDQVTSKHTCFWNRHRGWYQSAFYNAPSSPLPLLPPSRARVVQPGLNRGFVPQMGESTQRWFSRSLGPTDPYRDIHKQDTALDF